MASLSTNSLIQHTGFRGMLPADVSFSKASFAASFPNILLPDKRGRYHRLERSTSLCIKCEKEEESFEEVTVERAPYYSYLDSTSGKIEPASGARASIPGQEYWPEGTADRVRAANAPEPKGQSSSTPSFGKKPGSRRKKYRGSVAVAGSSEPSPVTIDPMLVETPDDTIDDPKEFSSEYVVYQTEPEKEELSEYELDKKFGRPHAFVDPKVKKTMDEPLTSDELWWNWRKPDKEQWSRWQRRRPDVETVFLKAMAETGQIKLYGEHPTLTEISLYRARRHLFKEERLQAEHERLQEVGPMAYYSEWVKAWKRDTSREAIQKHYEETGEDENTQLYEMFSHQTASEYRIMMGADIRIRRDPLAMRMREDQIKQIWGGDPVYPTINYIQAPDAVIDYRGPDFHEPTPNMLSYLKEHGKIISREELEAILAKEKTEELEMPDIDEAMARAVDIGENDDEEDSDVEAVDDENEKINRNWSVLKTTPQARKSKDKPKKKDPLSLEEAVDDSENLTDFLLDFEEDE
ncbi:protein PLASTID TRANSCRIPTIONALLY ACTIVE 12, chloroplastic [Silene latifolia]|uniref:protein PLASTID TRANSCRIPTIONALLY ACTIVE 12, chloroplastic n=1 Tax=Silene latifolia TaxID=37657 RepID=UPI003D783B9D